MNDVVSGCVMEDYSDAERLRVIRTLYLADQPIKEVFAMIGKVAFAGIKKSKE